MSVLPDVLNRTMGILKQHRLNVLHGKSLPTTKDLLRLTPYMANDLRRDMRVFGDIAARRVRTSKPGAADLKRAFRNLTLEGAGLKDVLSTCRALRAHGTAVLGAVTSNAFLTRCELYAASFNHKPMVDKAWRRCFKLAAEAENHIDAFHYLQAALGWYSASAKQHWSKTDLSDIQYFGESTMDLAFRVWEAMRMPAEGSDPPKAVKSADKNEDVAASPEAPGHLTILTTVANTDLLLGKRIADEFKKLTRVPLALTETPDLSPVQTALMAEFPWAYQVTRMLIEEIGGRRWVHIKPTILVGPPGCGKSRYCHRLLTLLGVRHRVYNCGGIADSSFSGTARHWTNAEPSLPLSLVRAFQIANPGIILDEIDKASDSRHNGSLFDSLLAMTEPESAAKWYDPYVQAPINLTGILWLGTANEASDIPGPLRDRFRILDFGVPEVDDLESLALTLMAELVSERGLHPLWARPLTWEERDALWAVWDGGSIRALRRYLEGVLRAREATASEAPLN